MVQTCLIVVEKNKILICGGMLNHQYFGYEIGSFNKTQTTATWDIRIIADQSNICDIIFSFLFKSERASNEK